MIAFCRISRLHSTLKETYSGHSYLYLMVRSPSNPFKWPHIHSNKEQNPTQAGSLSSDNSTCWKKPFFKLS